MPSPIDRGIINAHEVDGDAMIQLKPDDKEKLAALVFKVMTDPFVGRLTFVRIYSGTMTKGSALYNSSKEKRERASRLLEMHANQRTDRDEFYTGDILGVIGLKNSTT